MYLRPVLSALISAAWLVLSSACGDTTRAELLSGRFGSFDNSAPEPLLPLAGQKIQDVDTQTTSFAWTPVFGAALYELEIATDVEFNEPIDGSPFVIAATAGNAPDSNLDVQLSGALSFYWRVRANTTDNGVYSEVRVVHAFQDYVYVYCPSSVSDECLSQEDQADDTDASQGNFVVGNISGPFYSINSAIALAKENGYDILVAGRGDDAAYSAELVVLQAGVKIYGGYVPTDDNSEWVQNLAASPSIISSSTGSAAVYGINLTDSETVFDGFTIEAGVLQIQVADENLTVTNNTLDEVSLAETAGNFSDNSVSGQFSLTGSSSIAISNNTISGGIIIDGQVSSTLSNNTITGPDTTAGSDDSVAVQIVTSAGCILSSNSLSGGLSGSGTSITIQNEAGSDCTFQSNTISGAPTTTSYGFHNAGSAANLTNNTVNVGSDTTSISTAYGIYSNNAADTLSANSVSASGITATGLHGAGLDGTISDNTFSTNAGTTATAIHIDGSESALVLTSNTISGGTGQDTVGLSLGNATDYGSDISSNSIHGGSGTSSSIGVSMEGTRLSGNTINGGSGDTAYGVRFHGDSVEITDNIISGTTAGTTAYGIAVTQSSTDSLIITNNTIDGGSASNNAYGIHTIRLDMPNIRISENSIVGGSADSTYGIFLDGSDGGSNPEITIARNVVYGGSGGSGTCAAFWTQSSYNIDTGGDVTIYFDTNLLHGGSCSGTAVGMRMRLNFMNPATNDVRISANTIYSGAGGTLSYGLQMSNSAMALVNNTIMADGNASTESAVIKETGAGIDWNSLPVQNNLLFTLSPGATSSLYDDTGTTVDDNYTSQTVDGDLSTALTSVSASNNITYLNGGGVTDLTTIFYDPDGSVTPSNAFDDFRPLAGHLALDAGLDIYDSSTYNRPTEDIEGNSRPNGSSWDIGAYEQ